MLAMEVEYLMGRVIASRHDERTCVEWPPHPVRLYSALVAAFKECDMGERERAALEWLEALPPPAIYANPARDEGWGRDVHDVWVPINDITHIPERRNRQARQFPAFTPTESTVWFIWRVEDKEHEYQASLQRIAEHVTYLGHSMSPVRIRVGDTPAKPNLLPDVNGDIYVRTIGARRLHHLETVYAQREQGMERRTAGGHFTAYRVEDEHAEPVAASLFRYGMVLAGDAGARLFLDRDTGKLIDIMRKAIMDRYPDPIPEIISGHLGDGQVSRKPHLAIAPLANIGHQYADASIKGIACWLPAEATPEQRRILEAALAEITQLKLGDLGVWGLRRQYEDTPKKSLWLNSYHGPSDIWDSVTPVVFGKYPKRSQLGPGKNGGKVFAELCEMIGLPPPVEARVGTLSAVLGTPPVGGFIRPRHAAERYMAHVRLRFAEPVRGPLLLGARRFSGFGLCRPVYRRERENEQE